ncbi:MAG: HEAT repeat domain-containing protein [Deltaproteobacteria bacterium]|nr:HEAT repeat domain-containing protein [Deltaproteobacteria bacterium]
MPQRMKVSRGVAIFPWPLALAFVLAIWATFAVTTRPAMAQETCAEDDAECWIKVLKKNDDKDAMRAAMALGRLQSADAVDPLMDKLASKDQYMATAALQGLIKIGNPAIPALVDGTQSKKAAVRKYSGYALGKIGGGKAVDAIRRLVADPEPEVRQQAARAFGTLGDKSAQINLVELLRDRSRKVRLEAIRSLSTMPSENVAKPLVESGLSDLDHEVSMESAALLLKIGPGSIDPLLESLTDGAPYVRMRSAAVLGEVALKAGEPERKLVRYRLLTVAQNKSEALEVRQGAVVGLGSVGGPEVEKALETIVEETTGKTEFQPLNKTAREALARIRRTTS